MGSHEGFAWVAAFCGLVGIRSWLVPPLNRDSYAREGQCLLPELWKDLPSRKSAQVGLGDAGLFGEFALLHPGTGQQFSQGLGAAVVSHAPNPMPTNIECQLTFSGPGLARRHTAREDEPVQGVQRRGSGELDPVQVRLIKRLNEVVDERGLTATEVAAMTGFTQGHVHRILGGEHKETAFWVVARIAAALGVSLDWLAEAPRSARPASEPPAKVG